MGILNDRGRYYWVKRVPKRFAGLVRGVDGQTVTQVRQALHTDNKAEAKIKAAQIEGARLAEWEALAAGDSASARKHYEAARKLAAARGFPYRPVENVAAGDVIDMLNRVLALAEGSRQQPPQLTASLATAEALLGTVPETLPSIPEILAENYELTKTRHLKKSEAQRHNWKLPRERAVNNLVEVTSPKDGQGKPSAVPVDHIIIRACRTRARCSVAASSGMYRGQYLPVSTLCFCCRPCWS